MINDLSRGYEVWTTNDNEWTHYIAFSGNTLLYSPDSKDRGANMGPTWVLSAPGGPHVDPMNHAIKEHLLFFIGILLG